MGMVQLDLFGNETEQPIVDRRADAITKVREEMTANAQNPYIQVVGAFLVKHLNSHPEHAENLLAADKTVAKSLDVMKKEAEKKKVGSVAVLSDAEGFAIVLEYFGIESGTKGRVQRGR